jgi:hypothetical protein
MILDKFLAWSFAKELIVSVELIGLHQLFPISKRETNILTTF